MSALFKVFDRKNKTAWLVLNYEPGEKGGQYLAAREDDTELDGELSHLSASELKGLKLIEVYQKD